MNITGEGRFTADIVALVADGFSGTLPRRYQIGMQALFRSSGVADDQVDRLHAYTYVFAAGVAQEIDVLALVGPRVRLVQGYLVDADPAASLTLGGAAVDPWAPIGNLKVYPGTTRNHGGLVLTSPGLGMPAATGSRLLKMLPSAHVFSFRVIFLGSSE